LNLIPFLLQTVTISLSGVMAPGPISAVTVGKGTRSPRAGAWIAVGHGLFEIPLMFAILFGLGTVIAHPPVKFTIFIVGGMLLFLMGWDMFTNLRETQMTAGQSEASPVAAGILLSAGNPYFLIWWATVGAALLLQAKAFGWIGFLLFATLHWLCDLIWLSILSFASSRGGHIFGNLFQKILFGVCGTFLILFSIKFIRDGIRILIS